MTRFQRILNLIFFIFMTGTSFSVMGAGAQTPPPVAQKTPQVTYNVATTLPPSDFSYTSNSSETDELKKKFAKPQRHRAVTASKNEGLKHILRILTQKQTTSVLLTFTQGESSSCQLHLAFVFTPKVVGKKKTTELTLTVSSTQPLEKWQKELVNTLLKRDSFLARHPFGVTSTVSILGIVGLGIGVELKGFIEDRLLLTAIYYALNGTFLSPQNEFFFVQALQGKNLPLCVFHGILNPKSHIMYTEPLSIPTEATIVLIWIPCKGAITSLIENNRLVTAENSDQLKILLFPSRIKSLVISELNQHKSFLQENNYLPVEINSLLSCANKLKKIFYKPGPFMAPVKVFEAFLEISKNAAEACANFFNRKFTDSSTQESTIVPYERLDDHLRQIETYFTHPDYLIRYPALDRTWRTLGDSTTATTEIVILPTSALLFRWLSPNLTDENNADIKGGKKNLLYFCNIPQRRKSIKKSVLCMINDTTSPYRLSSKSSTQNLRIYCSHAAKFRSDGDRLRFDDFFIPHEPTANTQMHSLHYTASEPLGGHDSAVANEADDTNNIMKMFTTNTPTTTLELTYQAAAAYVHRILTASANAASAGFSLSNIDFSTNDPENSATTTAEQHEAIKRSIPWLQPNGERCNFKRFETDIIAALGALDSEIETQLRTTSAIQLLSDHVSSMTGAPMSAEPYTRHRLLLTEAEHKGTLHERSQLNRILADAGWQLVVLGKTTLSHNNNRYFANLAPGANPNTYNVKTNTNPEGIEYSSYQDAVIKIARALQANRLQMQHQAIEEHTWGYASPCGLLSSSQTISSPRTPQMRRTASQLEIPTPKSDAQETFEALKLDASTAWCASLGESEAFTYNLASTVAFECNSLRSKATATFMARKAKEARKYLFFTSDEQSSIDAFMNTLERSRKANIFIVSNYERAKNLHDTVTLTRASGKSHISLAKLRDLLMA